MITWCLHTKEEEGECWEHTGEPRLCGCTQNTKLLVGMLYPTYRAFNLARDQCSRIIMHVPDGNFSPAWVRQARTAVVEQQKNLLSDNLTLLRCPAPSLHPLPMQRQISVPDFKILSLIHI